MSQFNTRKPKGRKVKIRVTFKIDPDLYRSLKSKTYLEGTTPSAVFNDAARKFTARKA